MNFFLLFIECLYNFFIILLYKCLFPKYQKQKNKRVYFTSFLKYKHIKRGNHNKSSSHSYKKRAAFESFVSYYEEYWGKYC